MRRLKQRDVLLIKRNGVIQTSRLVDRKNLRNGVGRVEDGSWNVKTVIQPCTMSQLETLDLVKNPRTRGVAKNPRAFGVMSF